ncbi:NLR family CARD domain-containing protein 3 [Megalops cyprinoides]|uniref:NLR family CARD domain-containing protein 3 n=1 Tax=Megalops cyprinoides TaxID=118141 RepID=UPI001864E344|nr:NLR family CARD domain-containing protein 3 [Megalops cyprinoides]XP_036392838.1 NLR family CARD domain-containing protein 3 [Megalops cyprinoides]XP_036392839.1 NLR family CARD domain-containing protein 3 [Megalops cyprinoides]XP_036392840.1 NLR family CARD domain-containing protein 3 [Megalops cyprinoides]
MDPDNGRYLMERGPSPPLSYVSMESEDGQQPHPDKVNEEHVFTPIGVQLERADSPETRMSDTSHEQHSSQPREGTFLPQQGRPVTVYQPFALRLPVVEPVVPESEENLPPMELPFIFKSIQKTLEQLNAEELFLFKKYLNYRHPEHFETLMEDLDVLDVVDKMLERCGKGGAVKITLRILTSMKKDELASALEEACKRIKIQYELKTNLKRKYEAIFEGIARQGHQIFLHCVYTDVHMTQGGSGAVNLEHEVRQHETDSESTDSLKCSQLFEPSFRRGRGIRTVMTRGIAGIGLTVAVQKFIVDWTSEAANQDIQFVFPIPFREMNLVREKNYSLIDLLCNFYPEIKDMDFIEAPDCKVLFIFDGLDECRHTLSFRKNERWHDIKAPASVDMLLTNLIRGRLLPNALVWITTRSAASSLIPADCVNLLTQMRGFTDEQKEEYFRKRVRDQTLATKIVEKVKESRSLYIMCHIPLFCWILATVYERMFTVTTGERPMTVTQLYTHYILLQTNMKSQKYHGGHTSAQKWTDSDREFTIKLGKLAFQQLEKGSKEFNPVDLREAGLDVTETCVQSGVCTEMFSPMYTMFQQRVFRFVHLSIQEFMAALYVYLSFRNSSKNVLDQALTNPLSRLFKEPSLVDLHKSAVDRALQSKNGHLDLFLRFLLGLSMDSTQDLLRGLLTQPGDHHRATPNPQTTQSIEETVRYIRKKMRENAFPERCGNLRHCLAELHAEP